MATSGGRASAALCFDVEDLVAPQADDAVRWMADILADEGLTGTFMVVGERARQWERRGRRDVIEALKRHHVGFHSTWHSVHPTTTEICLGVDFREGMEALWAWDREGWEDAERIFGRPMLGWGRTGSSWAPSVMGLMGRKGRAYNYSLVRLPGHDVCWYGGCLSFYGSGIGGFDPTFRDDRAFEEHLAKTDREVDAYLASEMRGARWLCYFMCHPTRAIHDAFWDAVNFAAGANPPPERWRPAPSVDPAVLPTIRRNFRRLCRHLREDDRLEIVGWGELIRRYDGQRPSIGHAELLEVARRIAHGRQVLFTDHFSAGELLRIMCRAAAAPAERYPRLDVYGPLTTPANGPADGLRAADVLKAAAALDQDPAAYLPASVGVGTGAVGLGAFFVALAEALLGHEAVSGPADALYPLAADAVARDASRAIPGWVIHPPDMDLTRLLQQTRLQCWTLKPAWPRDQLPTG